MRVRDSKHVSKMKRDAFQVEVSFETGVEVAVGTFEGAGELLKFIRPGYFIFSPHTTTPP